MSKCRIAIVVPALTNGGGVPAVARFLYKVIAESDRYQPELISLATSKLDQSSVRLLSPASYIRGPQIVAGVWEELPFLQAGAVLTEFEFQRYRPRRGLTELLNGYDLIQVVSGTPAWALVGKNVARPVVLQVGTLAQVERGTILANCKGFDGLWLRWMTKATARLDIVSLRYVESVFVENEWMYARLGRYIDPSKVLFAPPGIDTSIFHPGTYQEESYILAVGRFADPRKNVKMLFEAYYHLRQAMPHSPRLMLVGKTRPSQAALDLLVSLGIADCVDIKLDVTVDKLAEIYRNAALFVLPSDEEGLGVVILEAMASGIPVISTRSGGPETIIVEGKTGCLTPVGDARALTNKIQALLVDSLLRRRLGEAGRRLAEERFSIEAAGKVYLEKYDELTTTAK